MTKLFYQGHGSFRLESKEGLIVYVDPYAGGGYDKPASLILVTHNHNDHNQTKLCAKKPRCTIITHKEALAKNDYNEFKVKDISVLAFPAYNKNHLKDSSCGYIITIDGIKIYASGDTSYIPEMHSLAAYKIDYALLCGDGYYNMGPNEAAKCAEIIQAKHNILIHIKPGALFDIDIANEWSAPNKIVVSPNTEIELKKA